jgi:hypothetical protein
LPEERKHIDRLTQSSKKFFARNSIQAEENAALFQVVNVQKNHVAGKRVLLKGLHCVTKSRIYTELAKLKRVADAKAEAGQNRKLKGRKGKGKSNPTPEPTIDPSLTLRPDMMEVSDSDLEEE